MTDELEAVDSAISELLGESPSITPAALRNLAQANRHRLPLSIYHALREAADLIEELT